MQGGDRKPNGRIENWWLTANLIFDSVANGIILYGEFYGLSELGLEEGRFAHKAGIWRVDFLERVVEFEDCYVKLGDPQSVEKVLAKALREK
jgi:hypothetical protein